MIGKDKKYIASVPQLEESIEDYGVAALRLKRAHANNINIPSSFVLTAVAFDDFLIANNLLEFIAPRINEVVYETEADAEKASSEILAKIMQSEVPEIIKTPLLKAYKGLGNMDEVFVSVIPSEISGELEQSMKTTSPELIDILGEAELLQAIKKVWSELFSAEALMHRSKTGYEGYLSQAVVIQKELQTEMSGVIFTASPHTDDEQAIEIRVVYGEREVGDLATEQMDVYFVNLQTEEILDKNLSSQTKMRIRKGKSDRKSPYQLIELSKTAQKRQKLDDTQIVSLTRTVKNFKADKKSNYLIHFEYEAGRVYYNLISRLDEAGVPLMTRPRKTESETKPVRTEPTVTPKKIEDEQLTIEVKPLTELDHILSGKGNNKGTTIGLVHFVHTERDILDLTGDEILVMDAIKPSYMQAANQAQGLVLRLPPTIEQQQQLQIPLLTGVADAFNILEEGEVITISATQGKIFLGAGKEVGKDQPQKGKIDVVASIEEPESVAADEIEPELEPEPEPELKPVVAPKTESEIDEELFKKLSEIRMDEKTGQIKTHSLFFQSFDPAAPEVALDDIDGLFTDLSDFYKVLGVYPAAVAEDPNKKAKVKQSIENLLITLLERLETKPVILKSSNLSLEEAKQLKGFRTEDEEMFKISGAARLLEFPKWLDLELEILKDLRNKHNLRNLWYAIPSVHSGEEQAAIKKAISAFGLRRSSTFKLLTVISTPLGALAIKDLMLSDTDGVIVEYDSLLMQLYDREVKQPDAAVIRFLSWVIRIVNSNNNSAYLSSQQPDLDKSILKQFIAKGLANYVLPHEIINDLKPEVAELEVKKLAKKKKRGRKKKKIDYGF